MDRGMVRNIVTGCLATVVMGVGTLFSGGCANQKDQQISALNAEIASLKEDKAQAEQARAAAEARAQEAAAKQPQTQAPGNAPPDDITMRPQAPERDVVITVAGDVLFASGQTTLRSSAKKELDGIARQLNNKYANHRIRIEGYTDSDPIKKSKFASNEALSQARAEAVEQYLVTRGVSASRLSAVGMGSAKPKGTKAASRRVEIVILGN